MADKGNVVITIARQYGSGGRITSKRLAEELGIPFYDEEILKMTSEESAIGEQYFRLADEKAGNNLLYRIVGGVRDSLGAPTSKKLTSRENLFRFQSEVIRKLAREQSCIIVGRCADYVLESEPDVRVVKPVSYTHLDVYKRQCWCRRRNIGIPRRIGAQFPYLRMCRRTICTLPTSGSPPPKSG